MKRETFSRNKLLFMLEDRAIEPIDNSKGNRRFELLYGKMLSIIKETYPLYEETYIAFQGEAITVSCDKGFIDSLLDEEIAKGHVQTGFIKDAQIES